MPQGSSKKTVKKSAKVVGILADPSAAVAAGAMGGSALGGRGAAAAGALSGLFPKAERKASKREYKAAKRKSRSPQVKLQDAAQRLARRRYGARTTDADVASVRKELAKNPKFLRRIFGSRVTDAEARRLRNQK
jgi:hypothetical protein